MKQKKDDSEPSLLRMLFIIIVGIIALIFVITVVHSNPGIFLCIALLVIFLMIENNKSNPN